ncbi:MAG: lipoyl(octanoyl) transferase LipB, partial [Mesorhizobium sp.]
VQDHGVTSLVDLGLPLAMADLDVALKSAFEDVFGPTAALLVETARKAG